MKSVKKLVSRDKIVIGRNVRLPQRMAIKEMAADLAENGMHVAPTAIQLPSGDVEIISGHRRIGGSDYLKETDPKTYQKWFGKGLLIEIISGISYEEAQFLKIDHGNELPLAAAYELQECANMLFDYGKTEKQVVVRLAGMLDRLRPMKANKRKVLEQMKADLLVLEASGNKKAIATKRQEIEDFVFTYRRGMVQQCHAAYRCPVIVMNSLYFKETGEYPEGVSEDTYLPARITTNDIAKLWKAFKEDLEVKDPKTGKRAYSKTQPGPAFLQKWQAVCDDCQEKDEQAASDTPRAKAMSHRELMAQANTKWQSGGFQLLTQYHANEPVKMEALLEADLILNYAELLAERAPDEWAEAVALAKGLEKEAVAETAEAAAKESASK